MPRYYLIMTNIEEDNNYSSSTEVSSNEIRNIIEIYRNTKIPDMNEYDRFEFIHRCFEEEITKFLNGETVCLLISSVTLMNLDGDEEFISRSYSILCC